MLEETTGSSNEIDRASLEAREISPRLATCPFWGRKRKSL
jgi:hypothetical protein